MKKRMLTGLLAGLSITALAAVPVVAQEAEPADGGATIEVVGVEYAYQGMPTSVPVGTSLTLRTDGIEFHELGVGRISDDATETVEELLAMGEAALTSGKIELLEFPPISALPGETSERATAVTQEGRYLIACFIPQGFDPIVLAELGLLPEHDYNNPEDWPPAARAILDNPPHVVAGMYQAFTVTAAGTEPGPLPDMAASDVAEGSEG